MQHDKISLPPLRHNPEAVLTAQEAATMIGIHRYMLYAYMRDGFISPIRIRLIANRPPLHFWQSDVLILKAILEASQFE